MSEDTPAQARVTDHVRQDANDPEGGDSQILTVGWREWVSMPELGLPAVKAKVDTGARTSAIHAFDIEPFTHENGEAWVAFSVLPLQRNNSIVRRCQAPLVDERTVTDSGGHREQRHFIRTQLVIGNVSRTVELTLAQRTEMLFRMLIGRTTLVPDVVVNPQLSYTLGRVRARALYKQSGGTKT